VPYGVFFSQAPLHERGLVVRQAHRPVLHYAEGVSDALLSPGFGSGLQLMLTRFALVPALARKRSATVVIRAEWCSAANWSYGWTNNATCWPLATVSASTAAVHIATAIPAAQKPR
jgi:hypothetical protein